jgi:hypothetical protein
MKDYLDAFQRPSDVAWIYEITLDEFNLVGERREIPAVTSAKVVEHPHPIASLNQSPRDM